MEKFLFLMVTTKIMKFCAITFIKYYDSVNLKNENICKLLVINAPIDILCLMRVPFLIAYRELSKYTSELRSFDIKTYVISMNSNYFDDFIIEYLNTGKVVNSLKDRYHISLVNKCDITYDKLFMQFSVSKFKKATSVYIEDKIIELALWCELRDEEEMWNALDYIKNLNKFKIRFTFLKIYYGFEIHRFYKKYLDFNFYKNFYSIKEFVIKSVEDLEKVYYDYKEGKIKVECDAHKKNLKNLVENKNKILKMIEELRKNNIIY